MTDEMLQETQPFRGVVTGASSGIGQRIAIELARQSMLWSNHARGDRQPRLLVHYRNNLAGARQTADAVNALGVPTELVSADICDPEERQRLLDQAASFLDRPTTWVNNAGADVLTGTARHQSFAAKLQRLLETDVIGTIHLSREVVGRFWPAADQRRENDLAATPPSMTFIGWDQAPLGMEGDAGQMFGPVKAAVMAFANSLAQEVAPDIRVNTIAPGWIKTAWGETTDSYWDSRAKQQSLMNRWGTARDVARAVCFAADPTNTFLTGQTLQVNGGWNRTGRPR
jgi:3-oxoacyl-[acyl-carrier protein] reductase